MRRQLSSKSDTCTEGMAVYAAGISVKVGAHYPGRSVRLPCARGVARRFDGWAEVSRGHSRSADRTKGPNVLYGIGARVSMHDGDAESRVEKRGAPSEGRGRNPREHGTGASSSTAARDYSCPGESRLMEAVVGRENMWRALKRVESNKGAAIGYPDGSGPSYPAGVASGNAASV